MTPNPPDKLQLRKGLEFSSQTSHSKFSIAEGHQKIKTTKDLRAEEAAWVGIFRKGQWILSYADPSLPLRLEVTWDGVGWQSTAAYE